MLTCMLYDGVATSRQGTSAAHSTRLEEVEGMCSVIEELERVCKEKETAMGMCTY